MIQQTIYHENEVRSQILEIAVPSHASERFRDISSKLLQSVAGCIRDIGYAARWY